MVPNSKTTYLIKPDQIKSKESTLLLPIHTCITLNYQPPSKFMPQKPMRVPEKNVFHVANNAITEDYEITSQKVAEDLANKEMAQSKTRKK